MKKVQHLKNTTTKHLNNMNIETGLVVLLIVGNAITLRLLAEVKRRNKENIMEYDRLRLRFNSLLENLKDLHADSFRKSSKIRQKDKRIQEQSDLIKQMEYDRDNI
jgi:hypothetical protein